MGIRDGAIRANLTLDIAVADDATEFIADEARVRQVLFNLLSNAVGFSKPGGVIQVSCWREAGYMIFSVEDQGVGIPKDQQASVFERFESGSQGSKHRGAGLGPFDRQAARRAAWRHNVAGIGAWNRHARHGTLPRARHRPRKARGRIRSMTYDWSIPER